MIGHHVPQRTCSFIVATPLFDADIFRNGNLDVIDILPGFQMGSKMPFEKRKTMFCTVSLPR